ncbi:DMT family transporter [Carboxydothermus ferrireducens]|uniref:Drug/metabolite transporter (DMT)-like permease n=1 Tax=Carboxydothermus ferrireducens DSM 11255 TaxID=1119529 RepID=A0ABX2R8B2_9THEO|nr:DMT family transporter [Carboxydothermus ferrireducens]NYE56381.1 drug/metabolite transporter (DMT)-like permease [Carboxydothermus ferrireducens DSM 11255]
MELKTKQLLADISLIAVTAFWGTTFVIIKNILANIEPFSFLSFRFLLSTFFLLPLLLQKEGFSPKGVFFGSIAGFFLWLGYILQTIGLKYTSAANSGFITGLAVVMVPVLSSILNKKPVTPGVIFGTGLSFLGLFIMSFDFKAGFNTGDLLTLAGALFFSMQIVSVERFSPNFSATSLTLGQIATVGVLSLPAALWLEEPFKSYPNEVYYAIVFTAIFATVLAFLVQSKAQQFTSASHVALIFTLEPVFALLFAVLFGGESLVAKQGIGAFFILAGMLTAEFLDQYWPKAKDEKKANL